MAGSEFMPASPEHCAAQAEVCEEAASSATTPELRHILLYLVKRWSRLGAIESGYIKTSVRGRSPAQDVERLRVEADRLRTAGKKFNDETVARQIAEMARALEARADVLDSGW